eukprot:363522-Chlamydomonas_euryale.AAC.10
MVTASGAPLRAPLTHTHTLRPTTFTLTSQVQDGRWQVARNHALHPRRAGGHPDRARKRARRRPDGMQRAVGGHPERPCGLPGEEAPLLPTVGRMGGALGVAVRAGRLSVGVGSLQAQGG